MILCNLLIFIVVTTLIDSHVIINTWSGVFELATQAAFEVLSYGTGNVLDAIESGCQACEDNQCDTSVGYGNHPDTSGHTSLDAMIMDGSTFDVGSVAYLRQYRNAIGVARKIMEYTGHILLVGEGAESFAEMMKFEKKSASTIDSVSEYHQWVENNCQPNYYENIADAQTKCGPYNLTGIKESVEKNYVYGKDNHDTIGMIAYNSQSKTMACGTTTNGANHKVAGRVGDSPIVGAGCYVDSTVGGAAATGDGDVMLRFLPSFYAVMLMSQGVSMAEACQKSILRIANVFPTFSGGMVCISKDGQHAGASYNMGFSYSYMDDNSTSVQVVVIS